MGVGEGGDDDDDGEEDDDGFRRVRGKGEEAREAQGEGNVSGLGVDFQLLPGLFAVSAVPATCHRSHAIETPQPAAPSQSALFHHFNVLCGISSSSQSGSSMEEQA